MILGDSEIKWMMAEGYFPAYPKLLINPASLNVRIGTSFLVPRRKWFGSGRWATRENTRKTFCKKVRRSSCVPVSLPSPRQ